jgi:nanoRNase/pAp phosphatase (c-di-AMP/oligoRNAs hydrolase)
MELSPHQQLFEQVKKATSCLLILPEKALSIDAVASAQALGLVLKKLGKQAFLVTRGSLPAQLGFLPADSLEPVMDIPAASALEVVVRTADRELGALSYRVEPDGVHIFLSPKTGSFIPADVQVATPLPAADLVILLDVQTLESLGSLQQSHADLFFALPKINIDTKPSNEYIGNINVVEVTASSLGELLADIFSSQEPALIDEAVATCLLAGIVAATRSFQEVTTSPKTLLKAAELIGLGARHQDVVTSLFKTKNFSVLKLWGRALARLKIVDQPHVAYSTLNAQDFERTESDSQQLHGVMEELLDTLSSFQAVALVGEVTPGTVQLLLAVQPHVPWQLLLEKLHASAPEPIRQYGMYQVISSQIVVADLVAAEAALTEALKATISG